MGRVPSTERLGVKASSLLRGANYVAGLPEHESVLLECFETFEFPLNGVQQQFA